MPQYQGLGAGAGVGARWLRALWPSAGATLVPVFKIQLGVGAAVLPVRQISFGAGVTSVLVFAKNQLAPSPCSILQEVGGTYNFKKIVDMLFIKKCFDKMIHFPKLKL